MCQCRLDGVVAVVVLSLLMVMVLLVAWWSAKEGTSKPPASVVLAMNGLHSFARAASQIHSGVSKFVRRPFCSV